jgi:Ca2+-binding RTX toxin-like protein
MAGEQTQTQSWSAAAPGRMFLLEQAKVSAWYVLNDAQKQAVAEAFGLWDDVSGFTAIEAVDDDHLARDATTKISYGPFGYVWSASLTNDWTRVVLGDIAGEEVAGVNASYGDHGRYHEISIDRDPVKNPGVETFAVGSGAFATLVHEVGHSVFGNVPHPDVGTDKAHALSPTQAIMSWVRNDIGGAYASTPMPLDIDAAIARFGAATTRTGDDTYGFNAHFSAAYRSALDFTVNTHPLITIYDSAGFDTLDLSGAESLFTGGVHIDLNPGAASYWLAYGDPFAIIYRTTEIEKAVGGSGNDEIFGNYLQNFIYGGAGDDTIFGGDGNDFLNGEGDNDTLNGGRGDDVMNGGTGNDNFSVDDPGDEVYEWAGDAGGRDKIYTTLNSYDLRPYGKGVWVEELQFVGNGNFVGIGNNLDNAVVGAAGDDWLFGNEGKDGLFGGQGSDHLFSGTEDDWLKSDEGNDFLYGDAGNDTLDGGADADEMHGGTGNDLYIVDNPGDQVIEEPNYQFFDFGFGPIPVPWGGIDTVQTTLPAYALSPNVENLELTGGAVNGTGNELANGITGNDQANTLRGMGGVDTLLGGGGADTLDGGTGADEMYGGAGDDTYRVDDPGDHVHEQPVEVQFIFNGSIPVPIVVPGGTDTVETTLSTYALPPFVENLTYVGQGSFYGYGNELDNVIHGGAGNDTLDGGDGGQDADIAVYNGKRAEYTITGSHIQFRITDSVAQRDGIDTVSSVEFVQFADGTFAIADLLGNKAPVVTAADQNVAKNSSLAVSSLFQVSDADNDAITNYRFWDSTADGASGHFVVNGVAQGTNQSIDVSAAQLAQTTFQTGTTADDLWVQVSDGTAWSAWKEFHLTPNATGNFITGTDADDILTGTDLDETILGLGGNDTLHGRGGDDMLEGGSGRNTLYGDAGNDTLIGGTEFDTLDGGDGNDTLIGGGGQNNMFGGAGNDTLIGSLNSENSMYSGTGSDTMTGGNIGDYLIDMDGNDTMHGGGGNDVMVNYGSAGDKMYGEDGNDFLDSGGAGSLLDGGKGDDWLFASWGGNTLLGGDGNDTLENQESGATSFFSGATGSDIFVYLAGVSVESHIVVTDFEDGIDQIGLRSVQFEQLTITDSTDGAVISYLGQHSPMVLAGIHASQITHDDFLLLA